MSDATRASHGKAATSLSQQALANLVDQFARPLDFLRELVQNSIDAGSPRVDIWVDHEPGVLIIGVDDHGSGMDEATIDEQLLSLYASTKEDDRTKIGKFGIGFTSVFALRPDRVLVRTGRHGTWWELVAGPDRVFDKHRASEPIAGTQVILFKRMPEHRVEGTVEEVRSVLTYWCEHAHVPITFRDRRHELDHETSSSDPFAVDLDVGQAINRPMDLVDAHLGLERRVEMPGGVVDVCVGYAAVPTYGFYNGGLTLLRTRDDEVLGDYAPRLRHLSFKVHSDQLEHTLTRDNVKRDRAHKEVLDAVARCHVALRLALVAAAERAAAEGDHAALIRWHQVMQSELDVDPGFAGQVAGAAVLCTAAGPAIAPDRVLDEDPLVAEPGHPLVDVLAEQGKVAVLDHPSTRRLLDSLLAILRPSTFPLATAPASRVRNVDEVWLRARPVTPSPDGAQLVDRAQQLVSEALRPAMNVPMAGRVALGAADRERVRLVPATFDRMGDDGALCVEGPDDGSLFRPRRGGAGMTSALRQRTLLVDVAHPSFELQLAAAHHDLELAAAGLALAVLHTDGDHGSVAFDQLLDATHWRAS